MNKSKELTKRDSMTMFYLIITIFLIQVTPYIMVQIVGLTGSVSTAFELILPVLITPLTSCMSVLYCSAKRSYVLDFNFLSTEGSFPSGRSIRYDPL